MDEALLRMHERLVDLCNDLIGLQGLCAVTGYEEELGRERASAALNAVISYLRDIGMESSWREPLLELSAALDDAKYGRVNPITKPAPMAPGTPNKLALARADDGMAAAAVDILHTHCAMTTDVALTATANALGYRKETLRQIRKNIRSPKTKTGSPKASKEAVAAYQYWLDELRRRDLPPRQFVDSLFATRGHKAS
nr:hypothetical protein [Mesorhizobium ciceri]